MVPDLSFCNAAAPSLRAPPAPDCGHEACLRHRIVEKLLRRARVIIEHYRRYNQPVDAREVVRRTLATQPPEKILQYRALLEEAVESFIHGFR
jgi:hypothetical protein